MAAEWDFLAISGKNACNPAFMHPFQLSTLNLVMSAESTQG
jgi:hypothetical protein